MINLFQRFKWIILPLSFAGLHLVCINSHAEEEAKFLSLRDAVLLSLRYNPSIMTSEINRVVQKFNLRVAQNQFELQYALTGSVNFASSTVSGVRQPSSTTYGLNPSVQLQSHLGTQYQISMTNPISSMSGSATTYNPTGTFSITQPLLQGAGPQVVLAPLKNAMDQEESNKLGMKQQIITTVSTVINDYYNVVSSNAQIIVQQNQLTEAQKTLQVNEAKIKVGMSEPTSIYQTEAQIETLKLSLTQAIIAAETAKLTLLNDIGLDPNTKIKISSDIDIPDARIPSEEECIAIALKNNISYLQVLIQVRADERNVTVQKNAQLWTLNATGSITTGASGSTGGPDGGFPSLANGRNFNQQAGLTLSVPIDNLPTQQLLVSARVALEQDKVNLEANKRALIISIKSQLLQLKSLYEQIKISESAVAMSQNAYAVEKKKQEIGRSSTLDVATSLTNLIQAQTNLISNKISYINAQTQLYSTLGTTLDVWRIKVRY